MDIGIEFVSSGVPDESDSSHRMNGNEVERRTPRERERGGGEELAEGGLRGGGEVQWG